MKRLFLGFSFLFFFGQAQASIITIDDFNTTNSYICEHPLSGSLNEFCASTSTPIDGTNTVWGSLGGGENISREISSNIEEGSGVATEICSNCQTAHLISDPNSLGEFLFKWQGPDLIGSLTNDGNWFLEFDWTADLEGAQYILNIDGFSSDLIDLGLFETTRVMIPTSVVTITSVELVFLGVFALEASIDNVEINLRESAIPEPTTLTLLGLGLTAISFRRKKRA